MLLFTASGETDRRVSNCPNLALHHFEQRCTAAFHCLGRDRQERQSSCRRHLAPPFFLSHTLLLKLMVVARFIIIVVIAIIVIIITISITTIKIITIAIFISTINLFILFMMMMN